MMMLVSFTIGISNFKDDITREIQEATKVPNADLFVNATKEAILQCIKDGFCNCMLIFEKNNTHYFLNQYDVKATFAAVDWIEGKPLRKKAFTMALNNTINAIRNESPDLVFNVASNFDYFYYVKGWCNSKE